MFLTDSNNEINRYVGLPFARPFRLLMKRKQPSWFTYKILTVIQIYPDNYRITSSCIHLGTREAYRVALTCVIILAAMPQCPTWQMEDSFVRTIHADCGVILSPNFPGLVGPGLWSWTLQGPDDAYFIIDVYYVRGPDATDSTGERLRSRSSSFIGLFVQCYLVGEMKLRLTNDYLIMCL